MKLIPPVKDFKFALYPLGDITQFFGENPALYAHLNLKGHNGVDIVRPYGEHMFAVADSVVCELKNDTNGYGRHIRLLEQIGDTKYYREWTYGHMSYIHVKLGQKVVAGQYIGNMGNSGFVVSSANAGGFWNSNPYAGTHVHWNYRDIKESSKGWSYQGVDKKVICLDYDNGYKGAKDPLELLWSKRLKSRKIATLASAYQKQNSDVDISPSLLYRTATIMRNVGL